MSNSEPIFEASEQITIGQDQVAPQPAAGASAVHLDDLPPPKAVARPFPLHPNFWWAILWCLGLVLFTQVPAGIVAVVVILFLGLSNPATLGDPSSPPFGVGIVVGIVLAHGLIILFSLLLLRIVAGRDWPRQVALRPPALWHLFLTVAIVPGFVLMGSGLDVLLKWVLRFPSVNKPADLAAFWAAIALTLLALAVGHGLCRLIGGRQWYRDRIEPLSDAAKWALAVAVLGTFLGGSVGGYLLLQPIAADVLPAASQMTGMEEMMKMILGLPLLAAVVVIGVFPGISEELWCRAFLGRGLVGKYGVFWGVLLTSFLFGAIHGDPRQGTMAMFMGVVLHLVYLASRSLFLPMLLHFTNNSLAVLLMRVPAVTELEKEPGAIPWHLYVAGALVLGSCLFAFWQSRAALVGLWQPEHPGVASPPAQSETRVAVPYPSWAVVAAVLAAVALFAVSFWVTMQAAAQTMAAG